MKRITIVHVLLLLFLWIPVHSMAAKKSKTSVIHACWPKVCKPGAVSGPNGEFAVWIFCDDAQATQIGVVATMYRDLEIHHSPNTWAYTKRFWQENEWARDVTSFAWDSQGRYLYVATSNIYGRVGVYQLDLWKRSYLKFYPENKSNEYLISIALNSLDKNSIEAKARFYFGPDMPEKTRKITISIPK